MSKDKKTARFKNVGKLLETVCKKDDKLKYLRVVVAEQEYLVKVPKHLREKLQKRATLGCWLYISGKTKSESGTLKVKAEKIKVVSADAENKIVPLQNKAKITQKTPDKGKKTCPKVLVCGKANCWKRGGKEVYEQVEASLHRQGLADCVEIKQTGCLSQCKKAPNMIVMPHKAKYTRVKAKDVPAVMETHFDASEDERNHA